MKDAYDLLFKLVKKDIFFEDGLKNIIYVEDNDLILREWNIILENLFQNKTMYIRGYGRDAKGTQAFFLLYAKLFGNTNIKKDGSNNTKPTQSLAFFTGLKKAIKTDRHNIELIQNYQVSHLFGRTKNPILFTAPWNIAYIPKYMDPFTGHETTGQHQLDFQNLFNKQNKERFQFYIEEYNSFIQKNIDPKKLATICNEIRLELNLNDKKFKKFELDVAFELSEIKL